MERSRRPVPILMYHHVNRYRDDALNVSVERFEQQIAHLSGHYSSLFLDDVEGYFGGRGTGETRPSSLPPVAVTFDDGYADAWFYAYPILKKHRVKATIFVNTARVFPGQSCRPYDRVIAVRRHKEIEDEPQLSDFLSWPEMREMEQSGLIRVESHTHHHLRCDASLSSERLIDGLRRSKAEIERQLGRECRYLAWPFGAYDMRATAAAQACGYRAAVTTFKGTNLPGSDLMQLRRITARDRSMAWFRLVLSLFSSPFLSEAYLTLKKEPRPLSSVSR